MRYTMWSRGLAAFVTSFVAAAALAIGLLASPAQAQPAPNSYEIRPGACDPSTGYTPVDVVITNVPDADGQPVSVLVFARNVTYGGVASSEPADNIADGEIRTVRLNPNGQGLTSAYWEFDFYENRDYSAPKSTLPLTIVPCGDHNPTPNPTSTDGGESKAKPAKGKVAISQYRYGVIKMRAVSAEGQKKTTFKRMCPSCKQVIDTFKVKQGKSWKKTFRGKSGDHFVLWARVLGRNGPVWRKLDEAYVKRPGGS